MASGTISLPDDTGWQDATLGSQFALYDADSVLKYRRTGKFVSVIGTVKPTSNLTISSVNNIYTITTLPVGFRPSHTIRKICQGSSQYVWLLEVVEDGSVSLSRYRVTNSSSYTNCSAGSWLPLNIVFEV